MIHSSKCPSPPNGTCVPLLLPPVVKSFVLPPKYLSDFFKVTLYPHSFSRTVSSRLLTALPALSVHPSSTSRSWQPPPPRPRHCPAITPQPPHRVLELFPGRPTYLAHPSFSCSQPCHSHFFVSSAPFLYVLIAQDDFFLLTFSGPCRMGTPLPLSSEVAGCHDPSSLLWLPHLVPRVWSVEGQSHTVSTGTMS